VEVGELRPEEQFAAACLGAALPGVVVVGHDDQSEDSMYDVTLVRDGQPFAACEVTATADANAIALWKLANNGRRDRWIEPALNKGWVVELTPTCHVRTLKQKLPAVLEAIEVDFWDWDARSRLVELGVGGFHPARTNFPGVIYCLLDRDHGLTGGMVPDTGNPS
jgi:hypothetical protein